MFVAFTVYRYVEISEKPPYLEKTINAWSSSPGGVIAYLSGFYFYDPGILDFGEGIEELAFDYQGDLLAVANADNLSLWDWKKEEIVWTLPREDLNLTEYSAIINLSFIKDSPFIFAADPEGQFVLIDKKSRKIQINSKVDGPISSAPSFLKDATLSVRNLESIGDRRYTNLSNTMHVDSDYGAYAPYLVNTGTKTNLFRIEGHLGFVTCFAFHPSRSIGASGGSDQSIKIWWLGKE